MLSKAAPGSLLSHRQGRSQKFILGGYNFYCTILQSYNLYYTSSLTTSAGISAQNNFQGLILGGYIYRYTPRRYAPAHRCRRIRPAVDQLRPSSLVRLGLLWICCGFVVQLFDLL